MGSGLRDATARYGKQGLETRNASGSPGRGMIPSKWMVLSVGRNEQLSRSYTNHSRPINSRPVIIGFLSPCLSCAAY
jgi:hypothetical protein